MADKADKLAEALRREKEAAWSSRNADALGMIGNVNQFLPVTGDIQSGVQAAQDVKNKKYASALLNSLGLLPFVPAMGGTIAKKGVEIYHGTTPEAAKLIEKQGFDIGKSADGGIWFTSNPDIGEVAAAGKGGIVKRILPENLKLGSYDEADKYFTDELIGQGYHGLQFPNVQDGHTHYMIFNPEMLKK